MLITPLLTIYMTSKFKVFQVFFILLAILSFQSCEGPEGPAGKDGVGTQGPKGDPGEPGTANVIYSEWKSVSTAAWIKNTNNGLVRYQHDITAPPLDQSIIEKGLVLVYVKLPQDENQVRPLPYIVTSNLTQVRLEYSLLEKKVRLLSIDPDQGRNLTPPDGQYRYVIVPGSQAGRIANEALSYEAAVELFNLPD